MVYSASTAQRTLLVIGEGVMSKHGMFVLTGFPKGDSSLVNRNGLLYPVKLRTIYVAISSVHEAQRLFSKVQERDWIYNTIQVRSVYDLANPTYIALIQSKDTLYVEEKSTILIASVDVHKARYNYMAFHSDRRYEASQTADDRTFEWRSVDCKLIVFKPVTILT